MWTKSFSRYTRILLVSRLFFHLLYVLLWEF